MLSSRTCGAWLPSFKWLEVYIHGSGINFSSRIIVGVKYCFRYNNRNRQLRNGETGEPIDLVTMPRTHRRRREKKLMTMDEVNDRFPLMKYKAWRASRASKGLPTTGGISAPNSRAQSMLEGIESANTARIKDHRRTDSNMSQSTMPAQHMEIVPSSPDEKSAGDISSSAHASSNLPFDPGSAEKKQPHNQTVTEHPDLEHDEDEDDPIRTSVPAELLLNPGDSCAICLDTIEEDDDVRGLTCGHAFHASCLDPWLTSRRACCPLCKADYYTPKPRPEGAETAQNQEHPSRTTARGGGPIAPQPAFTRGRTNPFRTTLILPGRFLLGLPSNDYGQPRRGRQNGPGGRNDRPQPADEVPNSEDPSRQRNWTSRLGNMRLSRPSFRPLHLPAWPRSRGEDRDAATAPSHANEPPTLRQLEAGTSF